MKSWAKKPIRFVIKAASPRYRTKTSRMHATLGLSRDSWRLYILISAGKVSSQSYTKMAKAATRM